MKPEGVPHHRFKSSGIQIVGTALCSCAICGQAEAMFIHRRDSKTFGQRVEMNFKSTGNIVSSVMLAPEDYDDVFLWTNPDDLRSVIASLQAALEEWESGRFYSVVWDAAVQSPGNLQASTEGAQGGEDVGLASTDSKVSPDSTKEGEGE